MIAVELFNTRSKATVEAATFPELEGKIKEFGMAHAPCAVWVGCASKPKMRGFDKWNRNGATKWLFEPLTVVNGAETGGGADTTATV